MSDPSLVRPQAETLEQVILALLERWRRYVAEDDNDDFGKERQSVRSDDIEELEAALASALPPATPYPEMGQGWRVEVSRFGDQIIAIEERLLAGMPEISDADAEMIRGCAQHLLSFIGQPRALPQPSTETPMIDKRTTGLYHKFNIERTDGTSAPGQKHDGCDYFVLDLTHDPHALPALRAYADSCRADYPLLARDLDAKLPAARPLPREGSDDQVTWRDAALRVGEALASDGPDGYYAMTQLEWRDWALSVARKRSVGESAPREGEQEETR